MLILRHDEQGCHAVHAHVLTWIIHGSDNKVRFGFQIRDTAAFLVAYCCGILNSYVYPS